MFFIKNMKEKVSKLTACYIHCSSLLFVATLGGVKLLRFHKEGQPQSLQQQNIKLSMSNVHQIAGKIQNIFVGYLICNLVSENVFIPKEKDLILLNCLVLLLF